jgi:Asp-tRNA(Asn)/Glu-tRNA(Gln) amidotransferase A subunit family amidase
MVIWEHNSTASPCRQIRAAVVKMGESLAASDLNLFSSALELAAEVQTKRRSALDVANACLARLAEVDAQLGEFTVVIAEQARVAAQAVDHRLARGEQLPLAGVPVAVKDHVWLAGTPATNGSRTLVDFVPSEDCVAVARLVDAGAVVIGKTNNPEFCYRGDTYSPLWGVTRNPWDLDRTPGGSSGGSAVAVATGMAALAVGTDGGGSIRIPAAFCGIVGHKPTFGLVPTRPGFRGWPTLSVHGPMGRTVADVATMLAVMAGQDDADPMSIPFPIDPIRAAGQGQRDLSGFRIAFSDDLGVGFVDPEVRQSFRESIRFLADLGCELVEAHPDTDNPLELWWEIAAAEGYASEGPLLARSDLMDPYSVRTIRQGEAISARDYLDSQHQRENLCRAWGTFLREFNFVVSPGTQVLPFPIGQLGPASDGTDVDEWWGMGSVANLTGQPVTMLPTGLTTSGLPVGIQIMGRRFADAEVLGVAATLQRQLPPLIPPPPFGPIARRESGG